MAYNQEFLDNYYTYIRSVKMIVFHIAFMTISVLGAYLSIKLFPKAYGRE